MSDAGSSPADETTGKTIRAKFVRGKTASKNRYASGKKYRLVLKRKPLKRVDPAQKKQAATLAAAAEAGTPFCEKCAAGTASPRSAAAPTPKASPAPPAVRPRDPAKLKTQAAQTRVLLGAAQNGTPFCEKCKH